VTSDYMVNVMNCSTFLRFFFLFLAVPYYLVAQSVWVKRADNIDPDNYYGVTLANGVVG
jgi:hypothetical protein